MSARYSSAEIKEWIRRIDERSLYVVCNEWERGFFTVVRAKLEAREQLTAQQVYHLERIIIHNAPLADNPAAEGQLAKKPVGPGPQESPPPKEGEAMGR